MRFIRNTPGLVPLAEKHASKLLHTAVVERRLVQAIVAPESPLVGELWVCRQSGIASAWRTQSPATYCLLSSAS